MSNADYMTNSEKLTAFLDGELETIEAESMFFDVAASPELQEEMRRQILITKTMKNAIIVPPPVLKDKIIAGIGLSGAIASGSVAVATTGSYFSRLLGSKVIMMLSTAAVAIIATVLVMLNFMPEKNESRAEQIAKSDNTEILNSVPMVSSSEILQERNTTNANNIGRSAVEPSGKSNAAKIAVNTDVLAEAIPSLQNQQINEVANEYEIISPSDAFVNSFIKFSSRNNRRFYDDFSNNSTLSEFLERMSLQLRFTGAKSFTDIDIQPINEPLLNNFALAMMYDLNINHSIGFELGQENFLQEFDGLLNEVPVIWRQNYIAFWAGLAYQYTMNEYSAIQPYGRVFAGGTRVGPIAKATIGAKYNISAKTAAFIGLENTGLFYEYQNNWFSSYKSGITAGVAVKF